MSANLFDQAIREIKDKFDMPKLIAPLLQPGVLLPIEFSDCDHLLERAQKILEGKSPAEVWALSDRGYKLLSAAQREYDSMTDRQVMKIFGASVSEKRAEVLDAIECGALNPIQRERSAEISGPRLFAHYLLEHKQKLPAPEILAAYAVQLMFGVVFNGNARFERVKKSIRDFDSDLFVPLDVVDGVVQGERRFGQRNLIEAMEAIAYAEGLLAEKKRRKNGNAQRIENLHSLMDEVTEIYLSNPELQSTSIENAAVMIHKTFFDGLKPKASTIKDYIRPYRVIRKKSVS